MASIGCRVGRILPRLCNSHRLAGGTISKSLKLRVNQTNIRTLVSTSSSNLKAQVAVQEKEHEESSPMKSRKSQVEDDLDRMLYKMDLEMRRTGRVNAYELNQVISAVKKNSFCTSTQGLLLLRCCGSAVSDDTKEERKARLETLIPLLKSNLKFDISHYNGLLRAYLENEVSVEISSFLAEMEENKVAPNRATYQHLIGLYCMEGNIAGATTILEHMKDEDMTINESVFHSLLVGHCLNRDTESVRETLEVMENSGLIPGAETYTVLLTSCAKARDWNRVEELLVEASQKDIQLDAGDYFQVIIALCENNMAEQAKPLITKIPKRAGFFQEMRSALPQVISTGHVDLAFDIFKEFKVSDSRDNSNHGVFMGRALAKSKADPEVCANHIIEMVSNGFTEVLSLYISESIERGNMENLKVLGKMIKEKLDSNTIKLDSRGIVRKQLANDAEKVGAAVKFLSEMGLRMEYGGISRDIIQKSINLNADTPGSLVQKIKSDIPQIPIVFIQNNMICALLERFSIRYFQACTGYMLNARIDTVHVSFWKNLLARSYLRTGSLEDFISILFVSKTKLKKNPQELSVLYESLVLLDNYQLAEQPNTPVNQIYTTVIEEINKHKIGIPRETADKINELVMDDNIKALLETAVADFESDNWNEEMESKFLEQRKKLHRNSVKAAGFTVPVPESRLYQGYFEIPSDVDEMLKIKQILKKRGTFNPKLADKTIQGLADRDSLSQCLEEIQDTWKQEPTFGLGPTALNSVVQCFIRKNELDGALQFFKDHGKEWFFNSLVSILVAHAKQENTDKVVELIGLKHDKKLLNEDPMALLPLLYLYQDKGDVKNINRVFNAILEARKDRRYQLRGLMTPLVKVHLVRDDVSGAIEAFEELVKAHKTLPGKMELMQRLVEDENVDGLQRVVDLSISVIGEENSLYDLTMTFLEGGRKAQAKKMLETPGLMYNHKAMTFMMDRFLKNNKIDLLEDLIRLSRNVFGCDRDYMYSTWVNAVFNQPEKVKEIWLEIQEEGHAPSTKLKTQIAQSLKAGNIDIPFVTTDLDIDGERKAAEPKKKKKSKTASAEKPATPAAEKPTKTEEPKLSKVEEAIKGNDITGLVSAMKVDSVSIKQLKTGLNFLLEAGLISQATECIQHVQYKPNKLRNEVTSLIQKIYEKKGLDEVNNLVEQIPEEKRRILNTNKIVRNLQMSEPGSFLQTIKSAGPDDRRIYNLPFNTIKNMFEQNGDVKSKLDELAAGGSVPANVVLGRYCCGVQDTEGLTRHWSLDNRDKSITAKDFVIDINSLDKLRWVCSTLNYNKEVVEVASNKCLANTKDNYIKEILEFSLQHGLSLSEVNTTALKKALQLTEFAHTEEVKKIIEERKKSAESS